MTKRLLEVSCSVGTVDGHMISTKLYYEPEYAEYSVLLIIDGRKQEACTYFTNCKHDARSTAIDMVVREVRIHNAMAVNCIA